jgi:hypothetical protein
MFSPVESQVIFLSKETPIVSIVKISYLSPIYMPLKYVFERNPLCILDKRHRHENWESSNGLFDWLKQIVQPIKKPVETFFENIKAFRIKNGFSLKKNHFATQISKRFASYRHFDRGNSD